MIFEPKPSLFQKRSQRQIARHDNYVILHTSLRNHHLLLNFDILCLLLFEQACLRGTSLGSVGRMVFDPRSHDQPGDGRITDLRTCLQLDSHVQNCTVGL